MSKSETVAAHPLPSGPVVLTERGPSEEYVSEVRMGGTLLARARNSDAFHAGMAHGAYLSLYAAMPEEAILAQVDEAQRADKGGE